MNESESSKDYESVYHRYSRTYLCDIICGVEPITREIATLVRFLRADQMTGCEMVAFLLSERNSNIDFCNNYYLGKALSDMAAKYLNENVDEWPL